jgi:hypothetical protein
MLIEETLPNMKISHKSTQLVFLNKITFAISIINRLLNCDQNNITENSFIFSHLVISYKA